MRIPLMACATALALGMLLSPARADTWVEIGDANGGLPAQHTLGFGTLDFIVGSISDPLDVDVFEISIVDGDHFTAEVISATGVGVIDPMLFLFSGDGRFAWSDDDQPPSLLPKIEGIHFIPGPFFLAVSANWNVNFTHINDGFTGPGGPPFDYTIELKGAAHANPEPGTMGLLGSVLAGAAAWRRRRRKLKSATA